MLDIKNGIIPRPQKVVIYGPEGIGKTTMAANFPDPLFIDTEGGTSHMDVRRINRPNSWEELLSIISEVAGTQGICKTLVIDTADWAEQLAAAYICSKYKKGGIEEFGYSKGYVYLAEEFARLLGALDQVIAAGMHAVVTAHAKTRKFEQPDEAGAYDRWEMKLTKQCAPLLKEWCDLLLFCNYKTYVVQSGNTMEKAKVQGGRRVMYTSHHPCWDAKNRHGLPDELPLKFENIAHIFTGSYISTTPASEKPINILRSMIAEAGVTEAEVQRVVSNKGRCPADTPITAYPDKFIVNWVIKYWTQILEIINNAKNQENKEDSKNGQ